MCLSAQVWVCLVTVLLLCRSGYECTQVGMSICTQDVQCVCFSVCESRCVHEPACECLCCVTCVCLVCSVWWPALFWGGACGCRVVVCVHMQQSSVKGVSLGSAPRGCAEGHTLPREAPADQAPCRPGWWKSSDGARDQVCAGCFRSLPPLPEPQQCDSAVGICIFDPHESF